jgi:phosphoglycolate phosphatase
MKKSFSTIIFDFDGVLVDTSRDISNAANFVLKSVGLEEQDPVLIGSYIGGGAEPLLRKCLGDKQEELISQALAIFSQRYSEYFCVETSMYPDVVNVLEYLRHRRKIMAIATNKVERLTHGILENFNIQSYFQLVIGPESVVHRKPHPECVLKILEHLGCDARESLMIGDTSADILAGKNAGTSTCGVSYGFGSMTELQSANPDIIIDRLEQLTQWVD